MSARESLPADRKWDVFRQTSTREVWACMGRAIEAESGKAAIESAARDLPDHLLGELCAVPSEEIVTFMVRATHQNTRSLEIEKLEPDLRLTGGVRAKLRSRAGGPSGGDQP